MHSLCLGVMKDEVAGAHRASEGHGYKEAVGDGSVSTNATIIAASVEKKMRRVYQALYNEAQPIVPSPQNRVNVKVQHPYPRTVGSGVRRTQIPCCDQFQPLLVTCGTQRGDAEQMPLDPPVSHVTFWGRMSGLLGPSRRHAVTPTTPDLSQTCRSPVLGRASGSINIQTLIRIGSIAGQNYNDVRVVRASRQETDQYVRPSRESRRSSAESGNVRKCRMSDVRKRRWMKVKVAGLAGQCQGHPASHARSSRPP
ncbi:hypothetical protein EGW08_001712 [Elysia chlorotica]|uniref:Uncharacterized protein n=1 Tax=Elysia chlorotica TaxID=188477 RepID=A0A433U9J6_ELYCH|nr:hypothetical protein EGW08_001712 [Elysia chlorotica]